MTDGWALTDKGRPLTGIYNEADLLIVESLATGLFDDLDPPGLAAVLSALTYRHRGPGESGEQTLGGPVGRRLADLVELWVDVAATEEAAGLDTLPPPDTGFARAVLSWTAGGALTDALDGAGEKPFTGGEFVRNVRLVADLLRQVAKVAPPRVARTARQAVVELERGVVALTREFAGDDEIEPPAEPASATGGNG
jgi:ATP-dependent RNA helicase HelY